MPGTSSARRAAVIALAAASLACRGRTRRRRARCASSTCIDPRSSRAARRRRRARRSSGGSTDPRRRRSRPRPGSRAWPFATAAWPAVPPPRARSSCSSRTPPADRDAVHEIQVRLRATGGTNLSGGVPHRGEGGPRAGDGDAPDHPLAVEHAADRGRRGAHLRPARHRRAAQRRAPPPPPAHRRRRRRRSRSSRCASCRGASTSRACPPGWDGRGSSDVYRETLVARAPERLRFDLDLPPQAAARRSPWGRWRKAR